MTARAQAARVAVPELARVAASQFVRHNLVIYASAIAFRALVALIPLLLLSLALLGILGLEGVWADRVAPAVRERVTPPVFVGIDFSVGKILANETLELIAFAGALALWDATWAARAVMDALNTIHDVRDERTAWHRFLVALGLGAASGTLLVVAGLLVIAAPRAAAGAVEAALSVAAWLVAAGLLALAVGLLVRYAPAERPDVGWASIGSVGIVVTWTLASLLFGTYIAYVADFTTAAGALTVFLVLTAYVFTSSVIFLLGAQLDEIARSGAARS